MRSLLVLILVALSLTGCSSNPNAIEPVDLSRIDQSYKVDRLWRSGAGSGTDDAALWLRLALSTDAVFAADARGRVFAFSSDRGKRLWKVDLDERISAGVSAGYGLVLVGSRSGDLIALSDEDGTEQWRQPLSSELLAPPAVGGGLIVAQTLDGRVTAFNVDGGEQAWQYESVVPVLSLRGTSTPVISNGRVYVGSASGKVSALELSSGVPIWEQRVAEPSGRSELDRLVDIDGSLIVEAGGVFAATYQGKLAVLDEETGRPFWDKDLSVYRSMDSDSGVLFIADDVSRVWAVDQRSSSALWKQEGLYGRQSNGVAIHDDLVVTGDSEGYLHWMESADGHFVARYRHDRDGFAGPLLVRAGVLYALSADGRLAAYRLEPRD